MINPKKVILQRIPLFEFLEILENLYNQGANYIDIHGISYESDDKEDGVQVYVKSDYMGEPLTDDEDGLDENISDFVDESEDITGEDINELLDL